MSEEDIADLNRVEISGLEARAGWVVNHAELIKVVKEFGLEHPVKIRFMKGIYRNGTHYNRKTYDGNYWHRICINQDLPANEANSTLWHELAHAIQSERWAKSNGKSTTEFYRHAYTKAKGRHGASYAENKYEVDARIFAEKRKERKLIV
jgi:hypothetical protein